MGEKGGVVEVVARAVGVGFEGVEGFGEVGAVEVRAVE